MYNPYHEIVENFLYQQFPMVKLSERSQFEAISAAVFGTKQRRQGPMPLPEQQVKVREVLKKNLDSDTPQMFYLPWGASKYEEGHGFDIAEMSALKQLRCLSDELRSYGVESEFHFRMEDLGDRYLLGNSNSRVRQIQEYLTTFRVVLEKILPNGIMLLESECTDWEAFREQADRYYHYFFQHLSSPDERTQKGLVHIGWKGDIPAEQNQYYRDVYTSRGIPQRDHTRMMAEYFSATLARITLGATRAPNVPHVHIAFAHPVPGNPRVSPRVHYRTIPERYTHHHQAPWNAKGFMRINGESREAIPRLLGGDDKGVSLTRHSILWAGSLVECDYLVV